MKSKEFGSWASSKMSGGGFRTPNDAFNKSLKGEPYRRYREYASSDLDEYHHYPEIKDLTSEEEEKKRREQSEQSQSKSKNQSSKAGKQSGRITRNLVSRVVAITAGTVVLVNTNPVLAERFPFLQVSSILGDDTPGQTVPYDPDKTDPAPVTPAGVLAANWAWSEDHESATLELVNEEGTVIATVPATVSVEQEKAETCTEEGVKTYMASATQEGTEYSDSYSEAVPPLGHAFGNAEIHTLDNGQTEIIFECTNCHEQFTISTSIEEND